MKIYTGNFVKDVVNHAAIDVVSESKLGYILRYCFRHSLYDVVYDATTSNVVFLYRVF